MCTYYFTFRSVTHAVPLFNSRAQLNVKPALLFVITLISFNHIFLCCFRTAFELEKKVNAEQMEHRQAMEQNLSAMARDLEKLRTEAVNAEKRARANSGKHNCDALI